MIEREEMFELMLAADPEFRPVWRAFEDEWAATPPPPHYLLLGDLARYLIAKLAAHDVGRFADIFAVVERWIIEGDHYVKEAAIIGLLENLQNTNMHDSTTPDDFLIWLGPQSRRWWDKVDKFWRDGTIIKDD